MAKVVIVTLSRVGVALALTMPLCCGAGAEGQLPLLERAHMKLENYPDRVSDAVISRIALAPPWVLSQFDNLSEHAPVKAYLPTPEEMSKLNQELALMPEALTEVLRSRLVGLYFVEGLPFSGYTSHIFGADGNVNYACFVAARSLKQSASELLEYRERTLFVDDDEGFLVKVSLDSIRSGALYVITHEAAHMLDQERRLTPGLRRAWSPEKDYAATPLTTGVWGESPREALPQYNFVGRRDLRFYMPAFGEVEPLTLRSAYQMYSDLTRTPFVTLYGSTSWSEDFAELVAVWFFQERFGSILQVSVVRHGDTLVEYSPATSELAIGRLEEISILFGQ